MVIINSIEQNYQQNYLGGKKSGENDCKSSFGADLEKAVADAANSSRSVNEAVLYVTTSSGKKSILDKNALISMCHAPTGESANVYRADNYSDDVPLYLVKGTDEHGNTYEKIVDAGKVDPSNCSYIELLALSAHTGHNDFFKTSVLRDQAGNPSFHDAIDYLSAIYDRMDDMKQLKQWDSYLRYDGWVTDILDFLRSNTN